MLPLPRGEWRQATQDRRALVERASDVIARAVTGRLRDGTEEERQAVTLYISSLMKTSCAEVRVVGQIVAALLIALFLAISASWYIPTNLSNLLDL